MNDFQSLIDLPEGFDGRVRLFPLPKLVLFPHVLQPLHIFEPRYCDLLADALATDQLITMATLGDGWEVDDSGRPEIYSQVCVGRILMHSRVEGDRHNVMLLGVRRGLLREEFSTTRSFRSARIDLIKDQYSEAHENDCESLKKQLLAEFQKLIEDLPSMRENLRQLAQQYLHLGPITDLVAFTAGIPVKDKLELLGVGDVERRARNLLKLLQAMRGESRTHGSSVFPPRFSDN